MVIDFRGRGEGRTPFRVLLVSDRSTCRGPAVQRLLRAHLQAGGRAGDILLGAAGTRAGIGEPIHPDMATALIELEIDAGGHSARQVTERRLAQADLVLTADRAQVEHVERVWPAAGARTFTVLEFARLAGAARPAMTPSAFITDMREAARREAPADPRGDDLVDLDGSGYPDHRRAVRMLDGVTREIARALTACVPATSASTSA